MRIDSAPFVSHPRAVDLVRTSPSKWCPADDLEDFTNANALSQNSSSSAGSSQSLPFRLSALSSQSSGAPSHPTKDGKYTWLPLSARREFAYRTDFEKANEQKLAELKEEQVVERPVSGVEKLVYEPPRDPRVAYYLSRMFERANSQITNDPQLQAAFREKCRAAVARVGRAIDAKLAIGMYGPIDYVTRRTTDLQPPPGYLFADDDEDDEDEDETNSEVPPPTVPAATDPNTRSEGPISFK